MFTKRKPSLKQILPSALRAAHCEYSMIASAYDDVARPTPELIQLSLRAIERASALNLSDISSRITTGPLYSDIWPGEHYKLLAAFVCILQPKVVIEIGTATGLSALALRKFLPPQSRLVTFDIMPWNELPNTVLKKEDFEDGILQQKVADLSNPETAKTYRDLLSSAQLIFIDATHDGVLERRLMDNLEQVSFKEKTHILFDDIRVWTMLQMWRDIKQPKIDLTSFGHWSGTGLAEMN